MKNNRLFKRILSLVLVLITTVSVCFVGVNAILNFEDEYGDFLEKLGYYESRNTYNVKNEYGYMGRWQIGYMGLIDVGFMDWDYKYTSLAEKYDVKSDEDFLTHPEAQDYCIHEYHKKLWSYIEYYGDDEYVGKKYEDITITVSGLLGAAHLAGAGGLHEMLKTGITATDAYGSKATFYLKELAGLNISKSIGADVFDPEEPKPEEDITSELKFYGNYSGINYMLGTDYSTLDTDHVKARNDDLYTLSVDSKNGFEGKNSLKIESKGAGDRNKNDLMLYTDTNDSYEENGIGDEKTMTLSFYAKSTVANTKMYWRWGWGDTFGSVTLSTAWKKYSITCRKTSLDGSTLHPYFDRATTVYLNQLMLVDGNTVPTAVVNETAPEVLSTVKGTYGKTYGTLPTPERSGYKFAGWFTDKTGGTQVTSSFSVKKRDIKVYARWTKITSYYPIASGTYSNHYYSVFDDDLTWAQAKTACEKMGGHLVTVNSAEEDTFITNLASSLDKGLYWIGCTNTSGSWKWITGETFSYTKWAPGQPSGGSEHYGEMYVRDKGSAVSGSWNDASGTTTNELSYWSIKNTGYICEFEPEKIVVAEKFYNDGKAYSVINSQISWDNARYYSELMGGHLVTVNDSSENTYVNSIVSKSKNSYYWIGAYDRNNDGKFSWVTGESFTFTNWDSSNPSHNSGIERCVELYKSALKWNDVKNIGRDGCTTGFIIETENYQKQLKSITIASKPSKLTYKQGEKLDLTGLSVKANYDTGESKAVTAYSVSGFSSSTVGTQKITVNYQGKTASFNVTVQSNNIAVKGVSLNRTSATIKIGETFVLTPSFTPSDASDKGVTWTSDNTSVVTVSSNGVVTGKSAGTANVTVKTNDGGYTKKCTVTVRDYPVSLEITKLPSKTNYIVGEPLDTTGIKVVATFKSGETRNIVTAYKVSGYDSSKAGQQTVTLSYTSASVTVKDSFTVTVSKYVAVKSVSLDKTSVSVKIGKTSTLNATVMPLDATNKNVTWTSSNTKVATVSSSGKITGKSAGTATVTAKTSEGSYTAKCTVTVRDYPVSLEITKLPDKTVYTTGEALDMTGVKVVATFKSGETRNIVTAYKVSGYNKSKAGVQTVTLTYTSASVTVTDTFNVTVGNAVKVTGVELKKNITYVKINQSATLSASVLPSNASNKGLTFTSSDPNIASVSSTGKVTGKALGTVTITVKTKDGGYTDKCTITVRDYPLYLTVTKNPAKQIYRIGEEFDPSGMTVYATFATGEVRKIVTAYKISGYDKSKIGVQAVKISYTSCSVTVTDTVNVVVY